MSNQKSALIIGTSRGIGLAIVEELLKREWHVVATCRGETPAQLKLLVKRFSDRLKIEFLDITNAEEISGLKSRLKEKTFNLLFVNAGVANAGGMQESIAEVTTDEFIRVMVTNSLSPIKVAEQLTNLVQLGGTIGIMSSGQGSIADNERGGNDLYRASKAALNMLMRSFAVRKGAEYALLLLAPGWIKTDMGGSDAKFSMEEVIPDIVNTLLAQEGQRGLRYLDRFGKPVRW